MESFTSILGVKFYTGEMPGLLELTAKGGLIVVPSAPVLGDLQRDDAHRRALEQADFAITDSGLMVLLWLLIRRQRLPRISGLRYLRALVDEPNFRRPGATFWIMPSDTEMKANLEWLNANGNPVRPESCYVAPFYPKGELRDEKLLAAIEAAKPSYVVICVGGGVQERLGHYLRSHLSIRPAIICTGAAIAFLSGGQVSISPLSDRIMIGWLLRTISNPRVFLPRYVKAARLIRLLYRYGGNSVKNP